MSDLFNSGFSENEPVVYENPYALPGLNPLNTVAAPQPEDEKKKVLDEEKKARREAYLKYIKENPGRSATILVNEGEKAFDTSQSVLG